jgi:hypothetical protein
MFLEVPVCRVDRCQTPFKSALPSAVRGALYGSAALAAGVAPRWSAVARTAAALANSAPLIHFFCIKRLLSKTTAHAYCPRDSCAIHVGPWAYPGLPRFVRPTLIIYIQAGLCPRCHRQAPQPPTAQQCVPRNRWRFDPVAPARRPQRYLRSGGGPVLKPTQRMLWMASVAGGNPEREDCAPGATARSASVEENPNIGEWSKR